MGKRHMGINMGHDRSVAVVEDGNLVVAIEQERLDRMKHSVGFMYQAPGEMRQIQVPGQCIRYCLDTLGISLSGLTTITANMPGVDHAPNILEAKFSKEIAKKVQVLPSHHLAHAYSAYWPSGFRALDPWMLDLDPGPGPESRVQVPGFRVQVQGPGSRV